MSEQSVSNPLLDKIQLPGRSFTLPSGAYLYQNGEVNDEIKRNSGDIHVHALTAIDEINMKNPDLLFNGKSVESVLSNVVKGIQKPLELFGRDIDAIMLFMRVVTYGPEYDIQATHNCENAKEQEYTVNLEDIIRRMKRLDPTLIESSYKVTLDNGQVVQLRPTRFVDVITALQNLDVKKKMTADEVKDALFRNLSQVIDNVDGIKDRFMIDEWLRKVPVTSVNAIAEAIDGANNWGPDFTVELQCRDCGEVFKAELPINPVSFFSE